MNARVPPEPFVRALGLKKKDLEKSFGASFYYSLYSMFVYMVVPELIK